ncbi:MAG: FGGY-family carbohydrate kinase, partial [Treponema sp.]|nr:FGGY-family carbohydrate kinase [Treponema sp.]
MSLDTASRAVTLCADIGTSSLKAAFIDLDGHELAFAREIYPRRAGGVVAQDWEEALQRALRALFSEQAGTIRPVAVCVSGNGPTLTPLTFSGEALPPLHWYDGKLVALPASKSFFLPHAAWLLAHSPREYEQTRYLISAAEWLSYQLGADPVSVLPAPAYQPYYWDEAQCRACGLDLQKFPPFVSLGSVIGRVSAQAERRFGLPAGLPLIAGGPDFFMALIGAGTVKAGMVCDRAGTSEGVNVCADAPVDHAALRVLPHVTEGLWNIGAVIADSGSLFDRYRVSTGQQERDYDELLRELIPDNAADLMPDLAALSALHEALVPTFSPRAALSPTLFGRATLETIALTVRDAIETLRSVGLSVNELRVSGGQSKNPRWNQLKADITGCSLLIPEVNDGELAGDAILAAVALGEASDIAAAVERMVRV